MHTECDSKRDTIFRVIWTLHCKCAVFFPPSLLLSLKKRTERERENERALTKCNSLSMGVAKSYWIIANIHIAQVLGQFISRWLCVCLCMHACLYECVHKRFSSIFLRFSFFSRTNLPIDFTLWFAFHHYTLFTKHINERLCLVSHSFCLIYDDLLIIVFNCMQFPISSKKKQANKSIWYKLFLDFSKYSFAYSRWMQQYFNFFPA